MQENTQEQTNPEIPTAPILNTDETPEVKKSPAEQAVDAVKIAKKMKEGYHMLFERELWSYLNALTAHGVNENQKYQLKRSIVRALKFAVEFKTGEGQIELLQKGRLSKIENLLAMAMVKIDESNMLIMADNLRQQDEAQANPEEGVKPLFELQTEESNNETKE